MCSCCGCGLISRLLQITTVLYHRSIYKQAHWGWSHQGTAWSCDQVFCRLGVYMPWLGLLCVPPGKSSQCLIYLTDGVVPNSSPWQTTSTIMWSYVHMIRGRIDFGFVHVGRISDSRLAILEMTAFCFIQSRFAHWSRRQTEPLCIVGDCWTNESACYTKPGLGHHYPCAVQSFSFPVLFTVAQTLQRRAGFSNTFSKLPTHLTHLTLASHGLQQFTVSMFCMISSTLRMHCLYGPCQVR